MKTFTHKPSRIFHACGLLIRLVGVSLHLFYNIERLRGNHMPVFMRPLDYTYLKLNNLLTLANHFMLEKVQTPPLSPRSIQTQQQQKKKKKIMTRPSGMEESFLMLIS